MVTVVVDYDPKNECRVTLHAFLDTEQKEALVCAQDLKREHPQREIVLLHAATWKELRQSNRKFFPVHRNR